MNLHRPIILQVFSSFQCTHQGKTEEAEEETDQWWPQLCTLSIPSPCINPFGRSPHIYVPPMIIHDPRISVALFRHQKTASEKTYHDVPRFRAKMKRTINWCAGILWVVHEKKWMMPGVPGKDLSSMPLSSTTKLITKALLFTQPKCNKCNAESQ